MPRAVERMEKIQGVFSAAFKSDQNKAQCIRTEVSSSSGVYEYVALNHTGAQTRVGRISLKCLQDLRLERGDGTD
jgi:hypothetical protein